MKIRFAIKLLILFLILAILIAVFNKSILEFFKNSTTTLNIISVVGSVVTIGSFVFALYEHDLRIKLEEKRRSQFWSSIDRARYTIFDHNLIKEISEELEHPESHRLWLTHQAACDLYISLIEQYLSSVNEFTYGDLGNMCKNGIIFWKWQERQWRYLISRRPENLKVEPPEYFVKSELSPYLQQKENQKRFMPEKKSSKKNK